MEAKKTGPLWLLRLGLTCGGTYLLGPWAASLIYWTLAFFIPGLQDTEANRLAYFLLAVLMQTAVGLLLTYELYVRPQVMSWREIGFQKPAFRTWLAWGIGGGMLVFFGLTALLDPYSSVETGTTFVCKPYCL